MGANDADGDEDDDDDDDIDEDEEGEDEEATTAASDAGVMPPMYQENFGGAAWSSATPLDAIIIMDSLTLQLTLLSLFK